MCEWGKAVLSYCDGTFGLVSMWSNVCFDLFFVLFLFLCTSFLIFSDSSRCFCELGFLPLFCMNGIKCFTWVVYLFLFFGGGFCFQNDIKNWSFLCALPEFVPIICNTEDSLSRRTLKALYSRESSAAVQAAGGAVPALPPVTLPLADQAPALLVGMEALDEQQHAPSHWQRGKAIMRHTLEQRCAMQGAAWWTCARPRMSRRPPARRGAGRDMRAAWILTVATLITARTAAGSPLVLEPEVLPSKDRFRFKCFSLVKTVPFFPSNSK